MCRTSEDAAVLVDFGIAKEFDPDSTTTAVRRCSPGYGAPEQYSKGTNTQTDIYGLGATLYTLLTGTVPEDAFYRMTQLGSKHNDPLEPINQLVPGIPLHIWAAIQQAMSINSTDRFQTAGQFWQALTAYPQQDASPAARMTPPPLAPMQYPLTPVPAVAQNSALIAPENQTTQLQRKKRSLGATLTAIDRTRAWFRLSRGFLARTFWFPSRAIGYTTRTNRRCSSSGYSYTKTDSYAKTYADAKTNGSCDANTCSSRLPQRSRYT